MGFRSFADWLLRVVSPGRPPADPDAAKSQHYAATIVGEQARRGEAFFRKYGFAFEGSVPAPAGVAAAVNELAALRPRLRIKDTPDVSIIITGDAPVSYVLNCLDSLAAHQTLASAEILVTQVHGEVLKAIPWIRIGAAPTGRILVYLNGDTRVAEHWLDELVDSFALFSKAGAIGSKLLGRALKFHERDPDLPEASFARQVDALSTAAFAITRDAWRAVDGAPERLGQQGFEVWMQPLACALHYGAREAGQRPSAKVKRILVVDAHTPKPDRDSGSFETIRMLKAFQQLGLRPVFYSRYAYRPEEASYVRDLQRTGVEVFRSPYAKSISSVLRRDSDFDYVLAYRYHVMQHIYAALKRRLPRVPIILHTVDLHFVRQERRAAMLGRPDLEKQAQKVRADELDMMRKADSVILHTPVEEALLKAELPVTPFIRLPYICEVSPAEASFAKRHDVMFLGGFAHQPNSDAVKFLVNDIWPLLEKQLPSDARLLIVGADPPAEIKALATAHILVTGHVPEIKPYFEQSRVFIAPLRYGAGIKGKVVQSLAHGLPAVLTPIAAEGMEFTDGREAMIGETAEELAAAVLKLYGDAKLWKAVQKAGYAHVTENYSQARCLKSCARALALADGKTSPDQKLVLSHGTKP